MDLSPCTALKLALVLGRNILLRDCLNLRHIPLRSCFYLQMGLLKSCYFLKYMNRVEICRPVMLCHFKISVGTWWKYFFQETAWTYVIFPYRDLAFICRRRNARGRKGIGGSIFWAGSLKSCYFFFNV